MRPAEIPYPVPESLWPEFVQLVENLSSGQQSIVPADPQLLVTAQRFHDLLVQRLPLDDSGLAIVHLQSIENSRDRSVGLECSATGRSTAAG